MQDKEIWRFIADGLTSGVDVCLIVMVDEQGSGPNRPGARLAVTATEERLGTVGGGSAEFVLIGRANEMLADDTAPSACLVDLDHRDEGKSEESGMICSGGQTFALVRLRPGDLQTVVRIADATRRESPIRFQLSDEGLRVLDNAETGKTTVFDAERWAYEETVGPVDIAVLIGGGHIACALSVLLARLGMRIVILDNRLDPPVLKSNAFADEYHVADYGDIRRHIPEGDRIFVSIMTHGHAYDEQVLEQLVDCDLRYLGMVGSSKKVQHVFNRLAERGISTEKLKRVRAPIGLPIGSQTPEEIAVSIAAEMISVKRGAAVIGM